MKMSGKIIQFIKEWTLIVSMIVGVAAYFIYHALDFSEKFTLYVEKMIGIIQPILIFAMLFLTFIRLEVSELKFRKWHIWLLLIQAIVFALLSVILIEIPRTGLRVILEGAMLCMICPTATAGAVITRKLGGDVAGITTYTILINLATAILIPTFVPFVHPQAGTSVLTAGLLILCKVFPLLLLPLITAWLLKKLIPSVAVKIAERNEISFYLWAVALALALTVTTRSIVNSNVSILTELGLVGVSLICCILQFYLGRKIGKIYGDAVTGGQSLGQKNTVLVIWMGYTFFSPVTAIVGGFYSIWHNIINSWQLYHHEHKNRINKES